MVRGKSDLSRVISHALRHEPWAYELELDQEGWTDIGTLLESLRRERRDWQSLTEDDLADMIRSSTKPRHEVANGRIRALYGHSIPGRLKRTPAEPPTELFHGTARATVPNIRCEGLRPMGRQFVHLSTDPETALAVARRKSADQVILRIEAREASQVGVQFYSGNEKVWLAHSIPARFITFC
jgi:putative RNA 2'-phosphotransferase